MRVGFTGSRDKPKKAQIGVLYLLIRMLGVTELDHGDCIGSDEEAHHVALTEKVVVHIHPPDNDAARAFCEGASYIYEPRPYLDRNKRIVGSGDAVIGMPDSMHEKRRSGTWATLRYAKKMNKPTYIIWPDGDVTKGWGRSAQEVRL